MSGRTATTSVAGRSRDAAAAATAAGALSMLLGFSSIGMLAAAAHSGGAARLTGSAAAPVTTAQAHDDYGRLPLGFEPNVGQAGHEVRFVAHGDHSTTWLSAQGMAITTTAGGEQVQMRLSGAAGDPAVTTGAPLPGVSNYLLGSDASQWHTGVPRYATVTYHAVYPGIDMVWHGTEGHPEYDFVVAPGAHPQRIAMTFTGMQHMQIDVASGDLVLVLQRSTIRVHAPLAYTYSATGRMPVAAHYRLQTGDSVVVDVGAYDHGRPLVIDPTFAYSTYLGGSNADDGKGIAVDAAGDAYIVGDTCSTNFPTTSGSLQPGTAGPSNAGANCDAVVTKLNAGGTQLAYSTYLGGSGPEVARGIALDGAGDAAVTGYTLSRDFPTTAGAFEVAPFAYQGNVERAFVSELNASGSGLVYSTYLGALSQGQYTDGHAVTTRGGALYVTGSAGGNPGAGSAMPTTTGALQRSPSGNEDLFLVELDPSLQGDGSGSISSTNQQVVYSTYIGGDGAEDLNLSAFGVGLAVDSAGIMYVGGPTSSHDLPMSPNSYQTSNHAPVNPNSPGYNAFIMKINPAGSGASDLVYGTYLGGSGFDGITGLALGPAAPGGSMPTIYVSGYTSDTDFPVTAGAFQSTQPGCSDFGCDGFVARLNPAGGGASDLLYSTYLGTAGGEDDARGIAVTPSGDAVVAGETYSAVFPVKDAVQSTCGCFSSLPTDAFATVLDPTASGTAGLVFSTFIGGTGADSASGVALDLAGDIYVAGTTTSPQPTGSKQFPPLPFPTTPGAVQPAFGGAGSQLGTGDAFVTNIAFADVALAMTASPSSGTVRQALTYTITASNAGPAPVTTTITDRLPKTLKLASAAAGCTSSTAKGITTVTCTVGPIAPNASGQTSITVTPSAARTVTNRVTEDGNAVDLTPEDNTAVLTTSVLR